MAEGDSYRINRFKQQKGLPKRMPVALRKYIQAQRLLCDWLPYEVVPETVVKPPNELYRLMSQIGFVWSKTWNCWRLDGRRKQPMDYFKYVERQEKTR